MIVLILLIFILENNDEMSTSNVIVKKIPVSYHVKKYLEYHFGSHFNFTQTNFLGGLITGVFRNGYRKRAVVKCDTFYPVHIKEWQLKRIGNHIEWEECMALNRAIHDVFRKQIFFHMNMHRKMDEDLAFPTMVQSLVEMNITEEDINYDSLYRDFKRKTPYPKTIKERIDFFDNDLPISA